MAEQAVYRFPRGGAEVSGPSVYLARELARAWGNVRFGIRIVSEDDERVHVQGYAWDIERNVYVEHEDKFKKLIPRKRGGQTMWIVPNERDLRELVNRRAAICLRNAILEVIPRDIVDEAMEVAHDTLVRATRSAPREQVVQRLVAAFSRLGITAQQIESYVGGPLDQITEEQIAGLREVYKSIEDGNSRPEEYFGTQADSGKTDAADEEKTRTEAVAEKAEGLF